MLGIASTAKDWGLFPSKEVTMDTSAGIAMGNRRGLGRAKHVDTQYRWVQERTAKKEFSFVSRKKAPPECWPT